VYLVPPVERGHVLGKVTGGILIGILLGRALSGTISGLLGLAFRIWFAAGLMIAIGAALALWLPRVRPITDLSYSRLIGSTGRRCRRIRLQRRAKVGSAL